MENTRREEIVQEANLKISIELIPFKKYFILGAEWADDHPRKGMVDIEEVCRFLKNFPTDRTDIINGLRKAMVK